MNHFKAITLLLVAAIANPLCCCFGVDAIWEKLVEQPVEEAHACCSMGKMETQGKDSPAKAHDDCPHEVERVSKISAGDAGIHLSKPLMVSDFLALEGFALRHSLELAQEIQSRPPPELRAAVSPGVGVAYCIYLL